MTKKIFFILIFATVNLFSTEFTFSHDTIWEHDPYVDSGFTVASYLINLSDDSLYVDSMDFIIDSLTFPKYEIEWWAIRGIFSHWYAFGNWGVSGYENISEYNKVHILMRTAPNDSLELENFFVDRKLSPLFSPCISKRDSIVPITMSLIFFSGDYIDTLLFKGLYNYDTPVSIQKNDIKMQLYYDYIDQPSFIYNCLGRRFDIPKLSKRNEYLAKGIYLVPNKQRIVILNDSMY